MADTMPTSVVVCGLPEAGRLHVQQRDGEAATLHDVYATGSLLCALPAQPAPCTDPAIAQRGFL